MPDITMCTGGDCPRREICYRHRAKPSRFIQSYFARPPVADDGSCDYFNALQPGDVVLK